MRTIQELSRSEIDLRSRLDHSGIDFSGATKDDGNLYLLSDSARIGGKTWSKLRSMAMQPEFLQDTWFNWLNAAEQTHIRDLIATQKAQGDMQPLRPIPPKFLQRPQEDPAF